MVLWIWLSHVEYRDNQIQKNSRIGKGNTMKKTLKLKEFKNLVSSECGFKIDFRTHAYLINEYGAYPMTSYDEVEVILKSAYKVAEQYITDNIDEENNGFWLWNFDMEMNKLKTRSIKGFFTTLVFDINNYRNTQNQ